MPLAFEARSPQPRVAASAMYIIFTCGEHTFRREVAGNEGTTYRCYNCGNYSGHVIKCHP